jgi:hypothetical protein
MSMMHPTGTNDRSIFRSFGSWVFWAVVVCAGAYLYGRYYL